MFRLSAACAKIIKGRAFRALESSKTRQKGSQTTARRLMQTTAELPSDHTQSAGGSLAVDIRGVSLTFETADGEVEALSNVDLQMSPKAISSPSSARPAAARPRLLRVIADLEQPTAARSWSMA